MTRPRTGHDRPRKAPRQARARATFEAILDATARILVTRGYDALTTNHVAARAGVSIGTLYEWFPGKDALVAGVVDRHLARAEDVLDALVGELAPLAVVASLEALAARMAEAMVRLHEDEPRLHRALTEEVPRSPRVRAHLAALETRMTDALAALLAIHPAVRVGDVRLAASLSVLVLEAATHRWATDRAGRLVEREALVAELALLLARYLGGAGSSADPSRGQPEASRGQPDASRGQPEASRGQPEASRGQPDASPSASPRRKRRAPRSRSIAALRR
ncbi:MAG: TetR/AcrR family transcriptional regulator [Sandaracinus sp.]